MVTHLKFRYRFCGRYHEKWEKKTKTYSSFGVQGGGGADFTTPYLTHGNTTPDFNTRLNQPVPHY